MSTIQFELLPPFFGNTKVIKGDGIPLLPDIEKILKFAKGDLGIANSIQKASLFNGLIKTDTYMTSEILDIYSQVGGLKLEKPSSDIEINYNNQSFKDSLYATLELGQLDDNYSQSIYQLDDSGGQVVNTGIPMPVALPCVKSIADNLETGDINAKSYIEYKKHKDYDDEDMELYRYLDNLC